MSAEHQPSEYQQKLIKVFINDERFKSYEEVENWAKNLETANERAKKIREEKLNGHKPIPYEPQPFIPKVLPPMNIPYHLPENDPTLDPEESCTIGVGFCKPLPESYHRNPQRALRTINRTARNLKKIFTNQ